MEYLQVSIHYSRICRGWVLHIRYTIQDLLLISAQSGIQTSFQNYGLCGIVRNLAESGKLSVGYSRSSDRNIIVHLRSRAR